MGEYCEWTIVREREGREESLEAYRETNKETALSFLGVVLKALGLGEAMKGWEGWWEWHYTFGR